jgi:hypothetical protein
MEGLFTELDEEAFKTAEQGKKREKEAYYDEVMDALSPVLCRLYLEKYPENDEKKENVRQKYDYLKEI